MSYPQAYHITWGTYGTRLPGSPRPHVNKDHNAYGEILPSADPALEALARTRMKQPPVHLTLAHRQCVDDAIYDVATRYEWTLHAVAPQSDHVHVVISVLRLGDELRDAIKAVTCRLLNRRFIKQTWWAEGGSCKYLFEDDYFANALKYVREQREIAAEPRGSLFGRTTRLGRLHHGHADQSKFTSTRTPGCKLNATGH